MEQLDHPASASAPLLSMEVSRMVILSQFLSEDCKMGFYFSIGPFSSSLREYLNTGERLRGDWNRNSNPHLISVCYSKTFVILKAADGSTGGIDHIDYAISNVGIGTDKCSMNAEYRSTCYQLGCDKPLRPLYVGINSTNDNASTAGPMILFSKLIDYDRDSMLVLHKYLEILWIFKRQNQL